MKQVLDFVFDGSRQDAGFSESDLLSILDVEKLRSEKNAYEKLVCKLFYCSAFADDLFNKNKVDYVLDAITCIAKIDVKPAHTLNYRFIANELKALFNDDRLALVRYVPSSHQGAARRVGYELPDQVSSRESLSFTLVCMLAYMQNKPGFDINAIFTKDGDGLLYWLVSEASISEDYIDLFADAGLDIHYKSPVLGSALSYILYSTDEKAPQKFLHLVNRYGLDPHEYVPFKVHDDIPVPGNMLKMTFSNIHDYIELTADSLFTEHVSLPRLRVILDYLKVAKNNRSSLDAASQNVLIPGDARRMTGI